MKSFVHHNTFVMLISASVVALIALLAIVYRFVAVPRKFMLDVNGKQLPGPPASFLGGNAIDVEPCHAKSQFGSQLSKWHTQYGPIFALQFPGLNAVSVSSPELIKRVLSTSLPKNPDYAAMELLIGKGLVTANGELWRLHRRLAAPAFSFEAMKGYNVSADRHTKKLVSYLRESIVKAGGTIEVDALSIFSRVTCDIICDIGFGYDLNSVENPASSIADAIDILQHEVTLRFQNFHSLRRKLPLPDPRAATYGPALKKIHGVVDRVIAERRAHTPKDRSQWNLLDHLIAAEEDGGGRFDDAALRDEALTFLSAGHETTAGTLTWCILEVARHTDVLNKARAEVLDALAGGEMTDAALSKMKYLEWVIKETLRLHPTVVIIGRELSEDVDIGEEWRLPKGTNMLVSIAAAHHDPTVWKNPQKFDPSRFQQDPKTFTFLPFGEGPRRCIGNILAINEAKIILARLLEAFDIEVLNKETPTTLEMITVKPAESVRCRLTLRT